MTTELHARRNHLSTGYYVIDADVQDIHAARQEARELNDALGWSKYYLHTT